jgi:hypothetical protein
MSLSNVQRHDMTFFSLPISFLFACSDLFRFSFTSDQSVSLRCELSEQNYLFRIEVKKYAFVLLRYVTHSKDLEFIILSLLSLCINVGARLKINKRKNGK